MRVDAVEWDEGNLYHATLRVSAAEVEQVIDDPASIWRVNRKGRTATHLVSGRTTHRRSPMASKDNPAADAAYWNEHLTDPDIDDGDVVEVAVSRPLTSTFSLRIPAAELDAIRAEASNAGVSVSEWVRTACTTALSTQENRQVVEIMANRAALQQLVRRLLELVEQESSELAHLSRLLAS